MPAIILSRGNIVRTSYGTGPYKIDTISGPCSCAEFTRDTPSDPHYHATCKSIDEGQAGTYHLGGYRLDGTSTWTDEQSLVLVQDAQMELSL